MNEKNQEDKYDSKTGVNTFYSFFGFKLFLAK